MTHQVHTMTAMHVHWTCVINVSKVCFCILIYPKSCKDLNCMIFEAIKLYYSSKYPFKVQGESDYTCVDLNNEVQFEDFPSKTYLLSKSITNRLWSFFMTFIIII